MVDWKEIEIQSGLTTIIDYRGKTPPKSEEGIPLISAANIKNGALDFSRESFISLDDYKEWTKRGFTKPGDVLITTEAPAGEVALLPGDKTYQISRRVMALRADEITLHNKFLFFVLQHPSIKGKLLAASRGSTVQRVLKTDITQLIIHIPNYEEQKAITAVLASLDDKIDLLHCQNETLEALAQTLFRHWFIDSAEDDWEECSLYDAIELVGGGTPKTKEDSYWNGDICWLSGGDIASNHKNFVISTEKKITELGLNNSSAKLLPKFSTVISARGTVGKYCILAEPMTFSQSNYGIKPNFEGCFFFTYLLIDYSVTALQSAAYGSVFDTITTRTFQNHIIDIPPAAEIHEFEKKVKPYFQRMNLNQKQIQTLEKLRDTLLPKLMSGEVRVRL